MPNELILIITLIVLYFSVLLWYFLFGIKGLYCFSIFATILANIEVLILVKAFGMEQTLGNILFATTFLITDVASEIKGKKESQKIINTNILTSVLFIFVTQMWLLYTPSDNDTAMTSIATLFQTAPRIVCASLLVYAVSQKLDVWLYHKWWDKTTKLCKDKSKYLYIRNNGSTLISQAVNAVLYNIIAFAGVYSWETVGSIIATTYVIYIFTSFADTPIVYLARKIYRKRFAGMDEDEVTDRYANPTFGITFRKKSVKDASSDEIDSNIEIKEYRKNSNEKRSEKSKDDIDE